MKKAIKIAGITLLVIIIVSVGGGYYLSNIGLQPNDTHRDLAWNKKLMYERYPFLEQWNDSLQEVHALKDTLITNVEGKKLHAFYIASAKPTNHTAVIVHGYEACAFRMMHIGYLYNHDLGYNILLPDLQYHGQSEGDAIQMGWKDRLDVMEWMDVANNLFKSTTKNSLKDKVNSTTQMVNNTTQIINGTTQMIVHGISMGAATTMMVSGEKLPNYVKAFVEDCGYTSVWDQFKKELNMGYGVPAFPILYTADLFCKLRFGWGFKEASALKQVKKCTRPMLFIHGLKDLYVPTKMVYPLFEAKPAPKQLLLVPGAIHAYSYKQNPKKYTATVRLFLQKYITNP